CCLRGSRYLSSASCGAPLRPPSPGRGAAAWTPPPPILGCPPPRHPLAARRRRLPSSSPWYEPWPLLSLLLTQHGQPPRQVLAQIAHSRRLLELAGHLLQPQGEELL